MRGTKRRLANSIRELRRDKGWTQLDLAERVGVSDATVSRWESGKQSPKSEHLYAILELRGHEHPGSYLDELVSKLEEEEVHRGLATERVVEIAERAFLGEHEIILLEDGRLLVNGHIWIDVEPGY